MKDTKKVLYTVLAIIALAGVIFGIIGTTGKNAAETAKTAAEEALTAANAQVDELTGKVETLTKDADKTEGSDRRRGGREEDRRGGAGRCRSRKEDR